MRLLFVCTGFLPYTFSENLCNGKLVYALVKAGYEIDIISKKDEGPQYNKCGWEYPWIALRPYTHEISYKNGNIVQRLLDIIYSCLVMRILPVEGIRWMRRSYQSAVRLHKKKHYDAILTRSPNDISHYVGLRFTRKFNDIKWLANWNDPAATIWPEPYTQYFPNWKRNALNKYTQKCLKRATYNSFPSESLMHHFRKFYPFLNMERTAIIPHIGLHDTIFPKNVSYLRDNTFKMCHSGNLSNERNPELLFKAIKELVNEGITNIRLDIMGYANDYAEVLINKYGLNDYVHFIGSFPYMDALVKMAEYDTLVLVEAVMPDGIFFPSKFTDYSQLEKPVLAISPKTGFARSMLEKYGGGIATDNSDCESIKRSIVALYSSWQKQTITKEYSSCLLFKQFAAENIVKIFNKLFNTIQKSDGIK